MNSISFLLLTVLAYTLAAPTSYVGGKSSTAYSSPSPIVTILKQISQYNDDGSYTFGYENSDGSFRIENMDSNGYLTGRYGYIDSNGQPQETEYVAGKMSGQSVGFQSRGTLDVSRNSGSPFPIIRSAQRSVEQKALDYSYSSVDDDEDGFPDVVPIRSAVGYNTGAGVVRLVSQSDQSYDTNPSIVRLADQVQVTQPTDVRLVAPIKSTVVNNPAVVRLVDSYAPVSNIRTISPSKTVRIVSSNNRASYRPKNIVRIANPTQSYEPAVIRVINRGSSTYGTPAAVKQTVTPNKQIVRVGSTVFRSPSVSTNSYDSSRSSTAGESLGPMAEFLRKIETNSRSFDSGYDIATENVPSTSNLVSSIQQFDDAQTIGQDDSISVDAPVFSPASI